MRKALFLDRDGVLNEDIGYVCSINRTKFLKENITRFASMKNYLPLIVTNQSGIAREYFSERQFRDYMSWFCDQLKLLDLDIKKYYFCPHLPSANCDCRKPKPGMFLEAKSEFNLDLSSSIMFGDRQTDIDAAKMAGITNLKLIS